MWIKLIRQRKLQSIMIFLIIAICTTMLTGAMSIITSLDAPSKDFAEQTHAAQAKVYSYLSDDSNTFKLGKQFAELSNVKNVEYAKSHFIAENILFNGKKEDLFVKLTEYNESIFGSALYIEGSKSVVNTLADDECILPAGISTEFDVHIGDTVVVKFVGEEVPYTVAAVYSDPFQTSSAFDSDILINELPTVDGRLVIYLYGKDGITGEQIEEAYREKYDGLLNGSSYSLEKRIDDGLIIGHIIGAIFLSIGAIMLLVSVLIIQYMIKNAMITDAKSIAVYKTIGYTSNDILFMYLKLYFAVVSLASIVGIVCSVFFSNSVLTSMFQNMGQLKANNPILPGIACYLVTVSFVLFVIAVIVLKTKRVKPVLALSGMDFGGVKKKKKYKGNSKLQFSALGIAIRTFSRNKNNAIGIIITCVVTIFSVNFAIICIDVANTMKENNDFWLGIDKSDVMINVPDSKQYDFVTGIVSEDERVDHYLNNVMNADVTMKWEKDSTATFMNASVYDDFDKTKLPVTEGRNPQAGNEIALSTKMSDKLNKKVGDYLEIYLGGEKKLSMLVTGIFQSYMQVGDVCRLTTSAYTDNDYDIDYDNISIYLKDSGDMSDFIIDMQARVGDSGKVIKRTDQFASIMNMIATPQQKAIPIVAALVLSIAGINIFSIVYLKNLKAQKINGIYKCIGYTTWHLIFSNLYYVTAIAVISVIITLPLSIVTYQPIMKLCLSMFKFTEYPVQFNYFHLAIVNLLIIAVFTVSTLVSSSSLFKVNARDLVQE